MKKIGLFLTLSLFVTNLYAGYFCEEIHGKTICQKTYELSYAPFCTHYSSNFWDRDLLLKINQYNVVHFCVDDAHLSPSDIISYKEKGLDVIIIDGGATYSVSDYISFHKAGVNTTPTFSSSESHFSPWDFSKMAKEGVKLAIRNDNNIYSKFQMEDMIKDGIFIYMRFPSNRLLESKYTLVEYARLGVFIIIDIVDDYLSQSDVTEMKKEGIIFQ